MMQKIAKRLYRAIGDRPYMHAPKFTGVGAVIDRPFFNDENVLAGRQGIAPYKCKREKA